MIANKDAWEGVDRHKMSDPETKITLKASLNIHTSEMHRRDTKTIYILLKTINIIVSTIKLFLKV